MPIHTKKVSLYWGWQFLTSLATLVFVKFVINVWRFGLRRKDSCSVIFYVSVTCYSVIISRLYIIQRPLRPASVFIRFQMPNVGFTLRLVLPEFTRSVRPINPPKENRFGWNQEHTAYIVWGYMALANFGRDPSSSDSWRARRNISCQVSNVRFLADVNSRSRSLYAIGRPSVVCLSVCRLSSVVCNVGAPYSAGWNFRQFFSPYDSSGSLVFWCQKSLVVDAPFPLKFSFKVTHPSLKLRNFDQYRLIVPQPW